MAIKKILKCFLITTCEVSPEVFIIISILLTRQLRLKGSENVPGVPGEKNHSQLPPPGLAASIPSPFFSSRFVR